MSSVLHSGAALQRPLPAGARQARAVQAPAAIRLPAAQPRYDSRATAGRQARPAGGAVQCSAAAADVGFVRESKLALPDGMKVELLHLPAAGSSAGAAPRPPLLFVHGSYHGAWCWRERWMPYFAAAGYDCWAVSLRGQGGSDRRTPAGEQLKVSGDLHSLTADLASVVASLPAPPVLVAHSFGALLAEKYMAESVQWPPLAGVACVCGVPPTGNRSIIVRVFKKSLWEAWKITWAFVGKSFARSLDEARFTFFSEDLPRGDLIRYQQQLADCSPVRLLDLSALNKVLPLPALPPAARSVPAFVGGGTTDIVVDWPAVQETAAWFGVQPTKWENTAHDCMLDTRWEAAAASLRSWLDTVPAAAAKA